MSRTFMRRAAVSGALAGAIAMVPAALPPVLAANRAGPAPGDGTTGAKSGSQAPRPPQLPRDFQGTGKWIVRDLGITVPFTWAGKNGDSQMVAGGPRYPIWFTNLIYRNSLYTFTYKWPGHKKHRCARFPGFNLGLVNEKLKTARFVGREILQQNPRRHVNHWRVGVDVPQLNTGSPRRFPLGHGDIYVDQHDPGTVWQVLQFGAHLYDPELDEWLVMDTFEHRPGKVALPRQCPGPS